MATKKRKPRITTSGQRYYTATVRLKGFRSASKSFPTWAEAKQWAEALKRELRKQRNRGTGLHQDVARMTVAGLLHAFLEDPETQALRYHADLQALLAWWEGHYGATKVLELNVLALREARATLHPRRAPATVNRYLSAMRAAWNWGRAAGLVPSDLLWPSRLMLTEPKGRTRYLSDSELQAVLEAAAAQSPTMHAAVLVSVGCGVRQSELRRLKWTDVDLDKQRLRVLITKNNESRSVYIPQSAVDVLRTLKRAPVVGQHVIADEQGQAVAREWLTYRWHAIRDAAKLADFRWHDLRHSCASFLAQQGASLLEIGSVLGHKSPSVTMRYSHLVQGAPVTGHAALDEKLRGGGGKLTQS
jgi:integrase